MNVEVRTETITEFWPKWQNEVINGLYPLHRLLSGSDRSAIFLTECRAQGLATAAIKLVPAERVTLALLSQWRAATELSHPHLIRLLDTGLCQLEGRQFLFVVMEYAEQTLAQVLPNRALTSDEARDMLLPTLDALAFLHGKNLVHGQLKPASLLVVNDQLKLSSDTIRPSGAPSASIGEPSLCDPPEARSSGLSPAGDIWALGVTLVEALTQRPPEWSDQRSASARLPAIAAPAIRDIVQRCLNPDPAGRPTAIDLQSQLRRVPQAAATPVAPAVVREAPRQPVPARELPRPRVHVPMVAAAAILLVAGWAALRLFHSHPGSPQPDAAILQPASQPPASAPAAAAQTPAAPPSAPPKVSAPSASVKSTESKPAHRVPPRSDHPAPPPAEASLNTVHEQLPVVPRSALATIHGRVRVAVLVIVDPSGNVIDALLENPGPSSYFARLAREAARKWKFTPADQQSSRSWLLRFEFTRGGTTARATPGS